MDWRNERKGLLLGILLIFKILKKTLEKRGFFNIRIKEQLNTHNIVWIVDV
jgi:hypothetical protein